MLCKLGAHSFQVLKVELFGHEEQGWITCAHVRDFTAHARANGLDTIPNLEKMAAFSKSFVWRPVYGEKVEPHWKR